MGVVKLVKNSGYDLSESLVTEVNCGAYLVMVCRVKASRNLELHQFRLNWLYSCQFSEQRNVAQRHGWENVAKLVFVTRVDIDTECFLVFV